MRSVVVVLVTLAALGPVAIASAAALGGIAGGVLAGVADVPRCDDTGVTVTYSTSGGNVTAVTVGGLADPGCEAAQLSVTLTDGAGARIAGGGPVPIPVDADDVDNTVVVAVDPQPAAEQVSAYHVLIVEP